MHILIVTHYFPPLQTVAAYRPLSWARHWSAAGHEVTVLTTPKGSTGNGTPPGASEPGYRVLPVRYLPWQHDGTRGGSAASPRASAANRWPQPLLLAQRQLRRRLIGALFDPRRLWVAPAVRAALDQHRRRTFSAVVSTYGPPATHLIASHLKRATGIPWVADYRDLWADHVYPGRWPFSALSRRLESRTVSHADLLTTTSPEWAALLARRFGIRAATIENGFDADALAAAPPPTPRTRDRYRIVYTGTLYQGDRDPSPLFAAVARLRARAPQLASRLEILFAGDLEGIGTLVRRFDVGDCVRILPTLPQSECLALQRDADLLLFVDWARPTEGWLTAKLFEYMHAGTPILAIGARLTASRLIEQMRAGVAPGQEVGAIEAVLERVLRGESLPYSPDPKLLAGFTRAALAQKMLGLITELVDG